MVIALSSSLTQDISACMWYCLRLMGCFNMVKWIIFTVHIPHDNPELLTYKIKECLIINFPFNALPMLAETIPFMFTTLSSCM